MPMNQLPPFRVAAGARPAFTFKLALGLALLALPLVAAERAATDVIATRQGDLKIHPINHATLVLQWQEQTIYVDPVGGAKAFQGLPAPTLILITHEHGDHLNRETLTAVAGPKTQLVAPTAVAGQLPAGLSERTTVLTNGQRREVLGIPIEAIPAYNLAPERQKFHPKGRGNGYVLTLGDKRVYLSGDTEDTPELRALKNIDVAFVCMNLPYTMDVDQAARAVLAFKPRIVYPYHCRGSDLEKFKQLVSVNPGIEVRVRDWYGAGR